MLQTMKKTGMGLLLIGFVVLSTWQWGVAATPVSSGRSRGGFGFLAGLDRSVGLTPEQRDSIRGLLAEQREASQALRQQTDEKIRAALTPAQQKKFDDFIEQQKNSRAWKPAAN
jgi:hypothetical protein